MTTPSPQYELELLDVNNHILAKILYKPNHYFNIEINTHKSNNTDSKNFRYVCHLILKQVPIGEKDKYKKIYHQYIFNNKHINHFIFYSRRNS